MVLFPVLDGVDELLRVLHAHPHRERLLLHLHPFSSLYTTPYGYALLVKLCFVALVFILGTWNWRRQRPRLGSEEAAGRIRRSSIMELSVATVVLIVTSILVSLPSPKH